MQRNSLEAYMKNMFMMKLLYQFTFPEIENMIPWERDLYIEMINAREKEKEKNG